MSTSRPIVAVYPGSFDPITLGHEDIVRRTLRFTDELVIAVAHTATHAKSGLFGVDERVAMIREVFEGVDGVEVTSFRGLLAHFARERNAHFVIRGLRAVSDFEYEFQMALMNQELWSDIETIFLTPDANYSFLSASLVREVAALGGDVGKFVSPPVLRRLEERYGG